MATTVVEQCLVAPSSGAPTEQLLKLLHFDILWLLVNPLKILIFYSFPCSESHFLDTLVPNLKNSLSLSLKHFPPLAGKILIPHNNNMRPVSHYVAEEDSVSLTIAVSSADFKKLTGYQSREADELSHLVPHQLPNSSAIKFSVLAFQVTLFPNQGVCIGLTGHHSICDGPALTLFMQAWASINKFNGDESHLLASGEECLPFYDRDVVADGDRLAEECWSHIKPFMPTTTTTNTLYSMVSLHSQTFRATFVLSEAEIQVLKNFVLNKKSATVRVSSFTVACAHLWTCVAKSVAAAGEEVADDEPEYLSCAADCRSLFNPPLPNNYFGNCMAAVVTESTNGKLRGNSGFLYAAEAIGEAIRKNVDNDMGTMDGSMKSLLELVKRLGERMLIVGGSPKLDFYGIDYGLGKPIKYETHLGDDNMRVVYFSKSRKYRGGIEIGVSMPKVQMDAFAAFFNQGIIEAKEKLWCKL